MRIWSTNKTKPEIIRSSLCCVLCRLFHIIELSVFGGIKDKRSEQHVLRNKERIGLELAAAALRVRKVSLETLLSLENLKCKFARFIDIACSTLLWMHLNGISEPANCDNLIDRFSARIPTELARVLDFALLSLCLVAVWQAGANYEESNVLTRKISVSPSCSQIDFNASPRFLSIFIFLDAESFANCAAVTH